MKGAESLKQLGKVGTGGSINEIDGHLNWFIMVPGKINQLIEQISWMTGPHLPTNVDIVLPHQMNKDVPIKFDIAGLAVSGAHVLA